MVNGELRYGCTVNYRAAIFLGAEGRNLPTTVDGELCILYNSATDRVRRRVYAVTCAIATIPLFSPLRNPYIPAFHDKHDKANAVKAPPTPQTQNTPGSPSGNLHPIPQMPGCIHKWERRNATDTSTQVLTVHELPGIRESRSFSGRKLFAAVQRPIRFLALQDRDIRDNVVPLRAVTTLTDYVQGWLTGRDRAAPRFTQDLMTTQIAIWKDSLAMDFLAKFPWFDRGRTDDAEEHAFISFGGERGRCCRR